MFFSLLSLSLSLSLSYPFSPLQASSRRRAKQSIALAERLVRSQNECRKLQAIVNQHQTDMNACLAEVEAARDALSSVSGPQSFVVDKMRDQSKTISSLNRQLGELQQETNRSQREVSELRQENAELREEMRIVLAGRKQLEEMRRRVEDMRVNGNSGNNAGGGGENVGRVASSSNSFEEEEMEGQAPAVVLTSLSTSLSSLHGSPRVYGSPRVREVDMNESGAASPRGVSPRGAGGGVVIHGARRWHSRN